MNGINLIWCHTALAEERWLRFLLSELRLTEIVSRDFGTVLDNSLYVVSCNGDLSRALPLAFVERLRRSTGKGLIHLSDERFGGGYHAYREFDFVIRNYHSSKFAVPGVMTIPLGFASVTTSAQPALAATRRPFVWSFLGNVNGVRTTMIRRLRTTKPHCCYTYDSRISGATKQEPARYADVLAKSAFSPCPMGNVNLETFRMYEALEAGSIPLTERRSTLRYFECLLPGSPILSFSSWSSAQRFVDRICKHPAELDRLQQATCEWWSAYKFSLKTTVREFCIVGLEGRFRVEMRRNWRYRPPLVDQVWRIFELLRHHNFAALLFRVRITVKRTAHRLMR